MLGKVKYFELRGNYVAALELVTSLETQVGSRFVPAVLERCKLLLAQQMPDWEHAGEGAQRALDTEEGKELVDAHRYRTLFTLSFLGDMNAVRCAIMNLYYTMLALKDAFDLFFCGLDTDFLVNISYLPLIVPFFNKTSWNIYVYIIGIWSSNRTIRNFERKWA